MTSSPLARRAVFSFAIGIGWLIFAIADSNIRWAAVGLGLASLVAGARWYRESSREASLAEPPSVNPNP